MSDGDVLRGRLLLSCPPELGLLGSPSPDPLLLAPALAGSPLPLDVPVDPARVADALPRLPEVVRVSLASGSRDPELLRVLASSASADVMSALAANPALPPSVASGLLRSCMLSESTLSARRALSSALVSSGRVDLLRRVCRARSRPILDEGGWLAVLDLLPRPRAFAFLASVPVSPSPLTLALELSSRTGAVPSLHAMRRILLASLSCSSPPLPSRSEERLRSSPAFRARLEAAAASLRGRDLASVLLLVDLPGSYSLLSAATAAVAGSVRDGSLTALLDESPPLGPPLLRAVLEASEGSGGPLLLSSPLLRSVASSRSWGWWAVEDLAAELSRSPELLRRASDRLPPLPDADPFGRSAAVALFAAAAGDVPSCLPPSRVPPASFSAASAVACGAVGFAEAEAACRAPADMPASAAPVMPGPDLRAGRMAAALLLSGRPELLPLSFRSAGGADLHLLASGLVALLAARPSSRPAEGCLEAVVPALPPPLRLSLLLAALAGRDSPPHLLLRPLRPLLVTVAEDLAADPRSVCLVPAPASPLPLVPALLQGLLSCRPLPPGLLTLLSDAWVLPSSRREVMAEVFSLLSFLFVDAAFAAVADDVVRVVAEEVPLSALPDPSSPPRSALLSAVFRRVLPPSARAWEVAAGLVGSFDGPAVLLGRSAALLADGGR